MHDFLDKMSAILETAVTPETRFREVEGWSSLMGFGILVTLENDFGRRMMVDEFLTMHTIADLAAACAIDSSGEEMLS
ncbi:MAG: acyl carrier protein [Kiritimatiellia bacterium]